MQARGSRTKEEIVLYNISRVAAVIRRLAVLLQAGVQGASLLVLFSAAGCTETALEPRETMNTPAGWRELKVAGATFTVPEGARAVDVQPIDSMVGILRGEGYEVIYDYGRAGESLTDNRDQPAFAMRRRTINGRAAIEVSFKPEGSPWGFVRMLQVQDGVNSLTMRVSCADENMCQLATTVFDSVSFT
jgi:hypothetical protein